MLGKSEISLALTIIIRKIIEFDMQNRKNIISSSFPRLLALIGTAAILIDHSCAATSAWTVDLSFDAFAGQPGGFADATNAPDTLRNQANSGILTRAYDVVQEGPANGLSGQPTYTMGQDGVNDLTIRTLLLDGSTGRWAKVAAEQRRGTLRMSSLVDLGTSGAGDFAVVAFEVSFASSLGVSADQLAIRLASANGSSQLYEWSMVTAGGLNDAPFSLAQLGTYNGGIYNADSPQSLGNGDALATGRSISQYLAGAPASANPSGGAVANGWWAIDDFNTQVPNGDESFGVNGGDGPLRTTKLSLVRAWASRGSPLPVLRFGLVCMTWPLTPMEMVSP